MAQIQEDGIYWQICNLLGSELSNPTWKVVIDKGQENGLDVISNVLFSSSLPFLGCVPSNDSVFICLSLLFLEDPNIFMYSIWLVNSVPVFKSEHHPIRCGLYISCFRISFLCCVQSGLSLLSASSSSSLC